MQQAAIGMLLAILGTLVNHQIVEYHWIVAGLVVGALIGAATAAISFNLL